MGRGVSGGGDCQGRVCVNISQQKVYVELEGLSKTERRTVWLEWRNQGGEIVENSS